jgi:glutathione synthase/RimK-type ligase-like ATP-grasp enzyme
MHKLRIAIFLKNGSVAHSTLWSSPWIDFCKENNIDYELVDAYQPGIIEKLSHFDVFLWHFSGYEFQDMLFARSVLYSAKQMGLKVFPDFNDAWHFDDKVAETYLLQSINAPIPESHMFYSLEESTIWIHEEAKFPIVAKLRNGSGSHNVKLFKTKQDAINYCKIMFSKGFNSSPSLAFKASSNFRSSKSFAVVLSRIKKIPEFLRTLKNSKQFPNEKGYVFFQEFIPNDGYDLKVVVVGDKLSFIARNTRKGDFRASGGGDLSIDRSLVTKSIIDSAFEISDKLGFKCMGYDYVVDKRNGEGKIVEISYGFSHTAQLLAGGHFDREGNWHDELLNAPKELLSNLLKEK